MKRGVRVSRREMLTGLGASSLGLISGCNRADPEADASETSTTVIFTDSTSKPSTDGDISSDDTQAPTKTPDRTTESKQIVFDGGDIDSFVDALKVANQEPEGRLVIEEGTYRFDPLQPASDRPLIAHARIKNLQNVTIEGNGSTLVFSKPLIAMLRFRGGKNITLENLALDYDPVPFTQGTIENRSTDPLTVRISLDEGFPALDHEMFDEAGQVYALVHEADGEFVQGERKRGSWDPWIVDITKLEGRSYELAIGDAFGGGGLDPGRRLTILARNDNGGLYFNYVDDPTLRKVSIHAANGGAFLLNVCKNPVLQDCSVAPPEGDNRHIGANADGIALVNCRSSATVEGCRHEYLGDDSLVVQHTISSVTSFIDERTVSVRNWHPFVVSSGDILDVLTPDGRRKGPLPPIADFEPRFELPIDYAKPRTITFEEPIDDILTEGDYLRNRSTGSQNFAVRNNEFRHHRANIIRIAASHGVIEDNVLEGCPINPIELETDTGSQVFAPKGWTSDVTVRNNQISGAGMELYAGANPVGIHVLHRTDQEYTTEGRPNRKISILGNDITNSALGGIHVEASEDITVRDNEMSGLNKKDFPGFGDLGMSLQSVRGAVVSSNTVEGTDESIDFFGIQRDSSDLEISDNKLVIDGESQTAELTRLLPVKLEFSRTVKPDSDDDRPLAFRCKAITLLDEYDNPIRQMDVGSDEGGVSFGSGVWPPSSDQEWRWFGGAEKTAWLYFAESDLSDASSLELEGYPMDAGISANVYLEEEKMDSVTFDSNQTQTYTVSLR